MNNFVSGMIVSSALWWTMFTITSKVTCTIQNVCVWIGGMHF